MTHQTKTLLKAFGILLGIIIIPWILLGGNKDADCPECQTCQVCQECAEPKTITKEVEVEKVVYKDSPETVEALANYEKVMTNITEGYITVFEIAESFAILYGQPIHQDYYDLYYFSVDWHSM